MGDEDKKINAGLVNIELPKSLDKAIENLTNEPSGRIGQLTADLFDLVMYPVHGMAERKRMKVDEKTERFTIERQKRIEDFKKEVFEKCKQISEENRVEPDEKTVSILKDAEFCLNEKEIRELFANLISKSMNSSYSDEISPAFSAIIKQFSSKDAKVFKHICQLYLELLKSNKSVEPIGSISLINSSDLNTQKKKKVTHQNNIYMYNLSFVSNDGISVVYSNVIDIKGMDIADISLSIDNIFRCNLIFECNSKSNGILFSGFGADFDDIEKWDCVKELIQKGYKLQNIDCYEISLSELGKKFYAICYEDID